MAHAHEHDTTPRRWVGPSDVSPAVQVVPVLLGLTIILTVVTAIFLF
jgi:hypothetical protein